MNHRRPDAWDDALLSAYVDGELSRAEAAEVEQRLEHDQRARAIVDQLRRLKEMTGAMRLKEPPAEEWEVFWQSHYNRLERSLGWILLLVGGVLTGGWGAYLLLRILWSDSSLPTGLRWGITAAVAGLAVLLVSVIRERLHRRKTTRYKDVVR